MEDNKKDKKESVNESQEPNYSWLGFNTKGTVAEPWPTAKNLWEDPEVQTLIKEHNKSVKKFK